MKPSLILQQDNYSRQTTIDLQKWFDYTNIELFKWPIVSLLILIP